MIKRKAERTNTKLDYQPRKGEQHARCRNCDYRNDRQYCKLLQDRVGENTICKGFQQQLEFDFATSILSENPIE